MYYHSSPTSLPYSSMCLHQNVTCCVKCPYCSVGLDPQQLHMALITNKVIFLLNVSQWRPRGLYILSCSTAQTRGNSLVALMADWIHLWGAKSQNVYKWLSILLLYIKMLSSQQCQEHKIAHHPSHWELRKRSKRQVSGGHTPVRDTREMGKSL